MPVEAGNFGDAFLTHVLADPEAPMIAREGAILTRGAFMARAAALARVFHEDGIARGDAVALTCADQERGAEAMLALWSLGAAPVFFDIRQTAAEMRASASIVGATRLYTDFKRLVREPDARLLPQPPDNPPRDVLSFDGIDDLPSVYLSSSGTTGAAKFRTRTHREFLGVLDATFALLGDIHALHGLTQGSLSFNAVVSHWLRTLTYGSQLISLPLFHTLEDLDNALSQPNLRSVSLAPVLIRDLLQHHAARDVASVGPAYPQLLRFSTVGGPIAPEDLQKAHRLLSPAACNTYSMSHAGAVALITGAEAAERPGSVGRPLEGVEVWIEGPDGARLPTGTIGSITVQMHWLDGKIIRPGDLGKLDAGGYLYVVGRAGQLACRNSVTVNLSEIESDVLGLNGVRDCMAFAVPDSRDGGDRIALAVESGLALADLTRAIRNAVSTLKHPDIMWVTASLPRNASGKISLKDLMALSAQEERCFGKF
ncbi:class I adenylate-forming enzyme family protein [Primorskyibacter sp. 2E107]|uniref:class I adenylate-forming enzyme family protein n=1 Tax=Primorskyibacter sp. 2E107 TaxID=3403458 RepID=UPI003AF7BEE6